MPRGGARPGCGRKPMAEEDKKVQVMITITREARAELRDRADAGGMTIGELVEQMLTR